MTMMPLNDRALLSVSGSEARGFLQGLVTNDAERVTPETPVYAALLTPQGKILFDFLIFEHEKTLLLDCSRPLREALQKRLSMYRLRAKIEIVPRDDLAVFASWDGSAADAPFDPRLNALGQRKIGVSQAAEASSAYLDRRLDLGLPEGADFGQDRIFALDAGLEELNGVSFDKGCYVGQELTARMKHRGTARKRLLMVESENSEQLATNAPLTAGGREIGEVLNTYGARGFALVRLDRLADAGDNPVTMNGLHMSVTKQKWLAP